MSARGVLAPIYFGPTTIRCPQSCLVPEGARIVELPPVRHALRDTYPCPNGCGRTLLLVVDLDRFDGA